MTQTLQKTGMNAGVNAQFAERVKARANIAEVLADFLELKRSGKDYTALCPFHENRHTGKFKVNVRGNYCHCFACGVTYSPIGFLMAYGNGMTYPDAVRYLANKYAIHDTTASGQRLPAWLDEKPKKYRPRRLAPFVFPSNILETAPDKDITITNEGAVIYATIAAPRVKNPLFEYLNKVFVLPEMKARFKSVCEAYHVETCDGKIYENLRGWCVFPLINAAGFKLNAKFMRYGYDGHRVKSIGGRPAFSFMWLHTLEQKAGHVPESANICYCLFGLHLLKKYPAAEVCIVESEKSAIIAQTFCNFDEKIFMATGGKTNLNRLAPLYSAGRRVVLYPDRDAVKDWSEYAEKTNKQLTQSGRASRVVVAPSLLQKFEARPAGGGSEDVADLLLIEWREKMEQMKQQTINKTRNDENK